MFYKKKLCHKERKQVPPTFSKVFQKHYFLSSPGWTSQLHRGEQDMLRPFPGAFPVRRKLVRIPIHLIHRQASVLCDIKRLKKKVFGIVEFGLGLLIRKPRDFLLLGKRNKCLCLGA